MHLNKDYLKKMIEEEGLVQNYVDLERQLTPNGMDLTVEKVERIKGKGSIDFTNENREIPDTEPVEKTNGWWDLEEGVYKITLNEIVDIPKNLVGYAFTRSSLLRSGCHIQNGFWEAGYNGKSECLLVVENPEGLNLEEDARVLQIAFKEIEEVEEGYKGRYSFD